MSDETVVPETVAPEAIAEATVSLSFIKQVKDAVRAGVSVGAPLDRFVGGLIEARIVSQAATLSKAFEALGKNAAELKKIQPKSAGFGEDLKPLPKVYQAEDIKRLGELKQKTQKLEAAVQKALATDATDETWRTLDEAIQKNG